MTEKKLFDRRWTFSVSSLRAIGPIGRWQETENRKNPINPACPVKCETYLSGVNPAKLKL